MSQNIFDIQLQACIALHKFYECVVLSTELIRYFCHHKATRALTFRTLALQQSESSDRKFIVSIFTPTTKSDLLL